MTDQCLWADLGALFPSFPSSDLHNYILKHKHNICMSLVRGSSSRHAVLKPPCDVLALLQQRQPPPVLNRAEHCLKQLKNIPVKAVANSASKGERKPNILKPSWKPLETISIKSGPAIGSTWFNFKLLMRYSTAISCPCAAANSRGVPKVDIAERLLLPVKASEIAMASEMQLYNTILRRSKLRKCCIQFPSYHPHYCPSFQMLGMGHFNITHVRSRADFMKPVCTSRTAT